MSTLEKEVYEELDEEMDESEEDFNKRMDEYYEWWKEEEKKETDEYKKKFEEGRHLAERLEQYYIESEKNKAKRAIFTILFYIIINTYLIYNIIKLIIPEEIGSVGVAFILLAISVLISVIVSIISYWINFSIFSETLRKSREENETIEIMKNRLAEIQRELDIKPKYEVENFLMNKHM